MRDPTEKQQQALAVVRRLDADEDAWTDRIAAELGVTPKVAWSRLRRLRDFHGLVRSRQSSWPQTSVPRTYWSPV